MSWALTLTLGTSQHARLCRMRLMAHTQLWQPCHLTSSLVCHCHLTYLPAKHHAMRDGNYLYASSISWQDAAFLGLASDLSCTTSAACLHNVLSQISAPCRQCSSAMWEIFSWCLAGVSQQLWHSPHSCSQQRWSYFLASGRSAGPVQWLLQPC